MVPWLDRYASPRAIRSRGAFHLHATCRADDAAPRVVVSSAPTADRVAAGHCLERLARAHRAVCGDGFPRVAESGECAGTAFVAFDCSALCDGESGIARLGETNTKVSYPEAIAVVDRLGRALEQAHRAQGPDGGPLTLDGVGWANVIFGTDGALHVIGLGHNIVGRDERGVLAGAPSFFVAPERAAGASATPSSDVYAFVLLQRSVLAYCQLPAGLERVFLGVADERDRDLAEIVAWSTEHVLAASPAGRPNMSELRARWEREWSLFGMTPDPRALGARLVALFADELREPSKAVAVAAAELRIARDASWLRTPSGALHRLHGRGALKRILLRLVDEHARGGGAHASADALFEAGWPGERSLHEAALNRVYAAVSRLRAMGLRDLLQRDDRGYRLDPDLRVRRTTT